MTDAELGKWLQEELPLYHRYLVKMVLLGCPRMDLMTKSADALTALVALLRETDKACAKWHQHDFERAIVALRARLRVVLGEGQ